MSIRASGYCFSCGDRVPPGGTNGNLFYCSDFCRREGWKAHHGGAEWPNLAEPDDSPKYDSCYNGEDE